MESSHARLYSAAAFDRSRSLLLFNGLEQVQHGDELEMGGALGTLPFSMRRTYSGRNRLSSMV
jgi:hypothetical protein